MPEIFIQLSVILGLALVLSLLMKFLRQPLIIGYILTGIILGPSVAGLVHGEATLAGFSSIGVALLLFIVGLGLEPKMIRDLGKIAFAGGVAQIVVTTILAYIVAQLTGLTPVQSLYIGFAVTLSSTIVVSRLLYNKEEQDSLYGRLSIGFLLVQDFITMLFFLILSATKNIGSGNFAPEVMMLLGKLALVAIGLYVLMKYITPRIDKLCAKSHELLFIFALAICFVIATAFAKMGFSLELGALLAGVVLSLSPYQREIATRLQSLRDFFLIIFFIVLGANVYISSLKDSAVFIIVFTLFILIIKPIILFFIMRVLKYTVKTSFLTSLTFTQISEFSLILLGMGVGLGYLPQSILGPVTLVGIITIAFSAYFISYGPEGYTLFKRPLHKLFKDRFGQDQNLDLKETYTVIVFGCHRLGGGLVKLLKNMKMKFLVVDHDPEVIRILMDRNIPCVYGSADDTELLDSLPLKKTELVISTIPELEVNLALISYVHKINKKTNLLGVANHVNHAERLYNAGATYVIMPPYLGRRFVTDLFKKNLLNPKKYLAERKRHVSDLQYIETDNLF